MHPVLIKLGPVTLHSYGLLLALGAALGLWLLGRLAKKSGLNPERVTNLAVLVLLSGILGARVAFVLIEPRAFLADPLLFFRFWQGGLVFYGGVAGGLLVGVPLALRWKLPALLLMDCFAPALALGQIFGRFGCFFAGCCYGKPWDGPCAVIFNDPATLAPRGIFLHPAQLYTALALALILAVLLWLWPKRRFAGQIFFSYGLMHGLARVIIEQFRGDWRGEEILGVITPTALFALGLAAASGLALFLLFQRNAKKGNKK